jgi:16S rRNA (guanine527-N7)-methyltransferase
MRSDFVAAVSSNQQAFGLDLDSTSLERLAYFHELVMRNNPLLHLVAPCSAEEFAVRHVLESLTLLSHLPENADFADVGTGAGLPGLPCLIVRQDLSAKLIESKIRKAEYLANAVNELGLSGRVEVIDRQFEEVRDHNFTFVTSRALDKFTEKLPRLLKWAKGSRLLLFGGPALGDALRSQHRQFDPVLMPMSEQRFLFVVKE